MLAALKSKCCLVVVVIATAWCAARAESTGDAGADGSASQATVAPAAGDRTSESPRDIPARPSSPGRALATAYVYAALLLIILLFTIWALKRFSIHFRAVVTPRRTPPTPDADVWAMHTLPEDGSSRAGDSRGGE